MSALIQTIGQKLKSQRLAKGVPMRVVAQHAQVAIPTISEFERDISTPSIKTLHRLCMFYGISLSEFFKLVEFDHPAQPTKQ